MPSLSAEISLRPIRFGFLVNPGNRIALRKALTATTCLWGGRYNPMIPILRKVPPWWDRHKHHFDTARSIANGYLDQFEPDFLVETEIGLAENLGYASDRVISIGLLLRRDGEKNSKGVGTDVYDLYRHMHRTEYQFERRQGSDVALITSANADMQDFLSCVFGTFPQDEELSYYEKAFRDAFNPTEIILSSENIESYYRRPLFSPLHIGSSNLEVEFHNYEDFTLYVLDAHSPVDLIDYWNLRIFNGNILPVPIQWANELSVYARQLIRDSHRPLPNNSNGVMMNATVQIGRSIKESEIEGIYRKSFQVTEPHANVRRDWYPSIWRETPEFVVRSTRSTVSASSETQDFEIPDEGGHITLHSLHPSFVEEHGNAYRWANVIALREHGSTHAYSICAPISYRPQSELNFRHGIAGALKTMEGFVVFATFKKIQNYWEIITGEKAVAAWMAEQGIKTEMSPAGRTTHELIRAMNGVVGLRSLANADIVKLLNTVATSPSKTIQQQNFFNRVSAATKDDHWLDHAGQTLVKRGALELGLELRCSICVSWSWHSISDLSDKVRCGLCRRTFSFPSIDTSNSGKTRWAYRLAGPFALDDFARGGYSSALAIRFFSDVIGRFNTKIAWSAGVCMTSPSGGKLEADFILWYQRSGFRGIDYPTQLVFGETKSFGRLKDLKTDSVELFRAEDIARMKAIATRYPSSIIVFATLRLPEQLSQKDVGRLRALAEWGQLLNSDTRRPRAFVMLLTGTELFSSHSVVDSWKKSSFSELKAPDEYQLHYLPMLTEYLQMRYLKMPSFHESWEKRTKKRRQAKKDLLLPDS